MKHLPNTLKCENCISNTVAMLNTDTRGLHFYHRYRYRGLINIVSFHCSAFMINIHICVPLYTRLCYECSSHRDRMERFSLGLGGEELLSGWLCLQITHTFRPYQNHSYVSKKVKFRINTNGKLGRRQQVLFRTCNGKFALTTKIDVSNTALIYNHRILSSRLL